MFLSLWEFSVCTVESRKAVTLAVSTVQRAFVWLPERQKTTRQRTVTVAS